MNVFNLFRHPAGLKDLNPDEVESLLRQNRMPLIFDVRTRGEFRSGHIAGAKNYPLGNERSIITAHDGDTGIILICKTGHRSQAAAIELFKAGFTSVSHLKGGMNAWLREGKPVTGR
ncbi:rhodanese-like domain-containing protein [Alicyclobacillus sp. SO9]|uniref:rhodanese-like domain-containing protein n=1 Tax=Alicyclobacillus sp. SO9 TaxID=2665646 RepID=UPI0018E78B4B|nr:rhodanese-like domain-containing protein [Alicyclobacillus sp. SO9]QQE77709.1 rhodanese-like domain-containing protein [Alicyclobacillus sp. SO9]